MKLHLLTVFSIVIALAVKSYTINAQDGVIDDYEIELLANWDLLNANDSLFHQKHINRIVEKLAQSPYVTEEKMGVASTTSDTYLDYTKLRKAAKAHELDELLVHPSPIIRVYAHRAIMENGMYANSAHVENMINDSTSIGWMAGNLMIETTVMDMVAQNMFQIKRDTSMVGNIPL